MKKTLTTVSKLLRTYSDALLNSSIENETRERNLALLQFHHRHSLVVRFFRPVNSFNNKQNTHINVYLYLFFLFEDWCKPINLLVLLSICVHDFSEGKIGKEGNEKRHRRAWDRDWEVQMTDRLSTLWSVVALEFRPEMCISVGMLKTGWYRPKCIETSKI